MDKIMTGYSRTNRIRLPEDQTSIDTGTVLGASTMNALLKANRTGDYTNVGNVLTVYSSVRMLDNQDNSDVFVVRTETVTVVSDKSGDHHLTDPKMVSTYTSNGFKITKTITKQHLSDGSIKEI